MSEIHKKRLEEIAARNAFFERFGDRPRNWRDMSFAETYSWAHEKATSSVAHRLNSRYDELPDAGKSVLARKASEIINIAFADSFDCDAPHNRHRFAQACIRHAQPAAVGDYLRKVKDDPAAYINFEPSHGIFGRGIEPQGSDRFPAEGAPIESRNQMIIAVRRALGKNFGEQPTDWRGDTLHASYEWAHEQTTADVAKALNSKYDTLPTGQKSVLARKASHIVNQAFASEFQCAAPRSRYDFVKACVSLGQPESVIGCLKRIKDDPAHYIAATPTESRSV